LARFWIRGCQSQRIGVRPKNWPKRRGDKPARKLSYVSGFAPWGWIIGNRVYFDGGRTADRLCFRRREMHAILCFLKQFA
jgi:signal transduction histidine kinase